MQISKLLRDLLALIIVAIGALAIWQIVHLMGSKGAALDESSSFSNTRKEADQAYRDSNWPVAVEKYQMLVEEDPFNGDAWFRIGASSIFWLERLKNPATSDNETQETAQEPITVNREESEKLVETALGAFTKARDFAFFRNESRLQIALIHVRQGETDRALKELREAVDDGFHTRSTLARNPLLFELKDNEAFQEILGIERLNINSMSRRRDNLPNVYGR